ncbi:hypothetical protein ABI59_19540 [Acidobacteria bacterium Mor1]|nr:hypothetical protein ABI59_19540 [Acidobacteria bacterium Mor1]
MRNAKSLLLVGLLAVVVTACGGGGGGDDATPPGGGGGSGNLSASFTAINPNPGGDEIGMDQGSATGGRITIDVNVGPVNNVYGATFEVTYPAMADYANSFTQGNWNDSCGSNRTTNVTKVSGERRLIVESFCRNPASPVNISGTRRLVSLVFDVNAAGSGDIDFLNPTLQNGAIPPQDIGGLTWDGGTIVAN